MTSGRVTTEEHPVLVREIVAPDGSRRLALRVFCSRVAGSVPLETCEACRSCVDIAADVDGVSAVVRCVPSDGREVDDAQGERTPVGTILRGNTLCVGSQVDVAALLALLAERELGELFVVDEEGRLVGLVRDVQLPSALRAIPGLAPEIARHVDQVMATATSVEEFTSVRRALRRMANAHLRALPVVTREGQLVGVLRDIDGLRWITAHRGKR